MSGVRALARADGWVALLALTVALIGGLFIRSATLEDPRFGSLAAKQALVLLIAAGSGVGLILVPYPRLLRRAWWLYAVALAALLLLPWFGIVINGARRWYRLPGFYVQPSELAKLAVIVALAAWLRFKSKATTLDGLLLPALIAGVPAFLVLRQPDLGSSLVFGPILLAMCFVAGAPLRSLLVLSGLAAVALVCSYFVLHDYQRTRVDVWLQHFTWTDDNLGRADVQAALRGYGFQPWQALIAIGSGGMAGFGLEQGPQNRYGFLPYRFDDYIFAVVCEESGLLGALGLLGLQGCLVAGLLRIAARTRERFGRLLVVGVATYLGTQSLVHAAVCTWLIPATGLPMPLVSYGGSSTLVAVWAVALALNVSARREPVLASDGYL
ncbi:MAG: FtsW/RodA/SpoVE family cell cycle protein [Planctomycetota bacterium]